MGAIFSALSFACVTQVQPNRYNYSHYDFSSLLCLGRYSFLLAMPNWTHASRGYEQTKFVKSERARRPSGRHLLALLFLPHPPHPSALTEAACTVVHVVFI